MLVEKEHRRLDSDQTVVILRVEGLIKLGESSEFFVSAVESLWGQNLIVDLSKVDYIDSTGLGEFIGSCVAVARAGQAMVLMHESERVDKLLKIAHATEDLRVLAIDEAAEYRASSKDPGGGEQDSDHAPSAPTRVVTTRDTRVERGSTAATKQTRVVAFHGDLQQIEYRFFPWRVARKIGLKGWIQNMPDGTVVAWVEGEQLAIEEWLSDVRDGPFGSYVTRIEQELMDFTGKLDEFEVKL